MQQQNEIEPYYYRRWFIKYIKNGSTYEIFKVSEFDKKIVSFDAYTDELILENNKRVKTYKTFKEAALIAIPNIITNKKEKWNKIVEKSYKLNEEIGDLFDKLDKLKNFP